MSTTTPSALAPMDVGRADVLPGYFLSKPRWGDYAELESTFNRLYTASMMAGVVGFPPDVIKAVAEVVASELRKRPLAYGRAGFDEAVFQWPVFPLLLWLSLRVKHGTVTLAQAEAMVAGMDDAQRADVRRAILEMIGYDFGGTKPKEGGKAEGEPLDFRGLYKVLREKKGLAPSEILNLTLDQVLTELGVDPEVEELKAEQERRRKAKQREVLDKAAAKLGLELGALKDRPIDDVVAAVKDVTGAEANPAAVQQAIAELAATL